MKGEYQIDVWLSHWIPSVDGVRSTGSSLLVFAEDTWYFMFEDEYSMATYACM